MDRRGHRHLGDDGSSSEVGHAMVEWWPQGAASLGVMQGPSSLDRGSFEVLQNLRLCKRSAKEETALISRSHDPFFRGECCISRNDGIRDPLHVSISAWQERHRKVAES